MLISAKTMWPISIFFSAKEAQLLFWQLQKLSARNISALKCESRKTKCWVLWYPLMQLSVKGPYADHILIPQGSTERPEVVQF